MKFEIKITDASLEDLSRLTSALNGETIRVTESPALKMQQFGRIERPVELDIKPNEVDALPEELNERRFETVELDKQQQEEIQELAEQVKPETDAEGLPWDERIHSSNQKTKADGSWHRKKGITDDYFEEIKAELMGTPIEQAQQAPAQVVEQTQAFTPPVPATPETVVPSPALAPVAQPNDFNSILARIQNAFATGRATMTLMPDLVAEINQRGNVQMGSVTDMVGNQNLIDIAAQVLTEKGL